MTLGLRKRLAFVVVAAAFILLSGGRPAPAQVPGIAAPVLKWHRGGCFSTWCQTGWYSSPAVADLDGDGQNEVVWGSYDVVALEGASGALRWRGSNGSRVWPGVAVADLTGDGTLEVIVGRGNDQLTVYNRNGGVVWSAHPFGGGEVRSLAVEDLEGDGKLEVIVGRASSGATKQVSVYNAGGAKRSGFPARRDAAPGYGAGIYNQNIAVGDVNGDGYREIIAPTDTHYITALNRSGGQLAASPIYGSGKVWSQVGVHVDHAVDLRGYANCGSEHRPNFANGAASIADLDGDGSREIVILGDVYNCAIGDNEAGDLHYLPWILRLDRTRWTTGSFDWTALPAPASGSGPLSEDYSVIENSVSNPVLADLDDDGQKEIVYAAYDGRVHAYWLDKTQKGNWPYAVPGTGMRFAAEPAVADLDNDGHAEVIFTSWPEKGGTAVGRLHVLDWQGNPLHEVALPGSFSAGSWNGGLAAPTLADIDGDADLEVVVGTAHSGVVAYDLPGTASARVLWGTGRGNLQRTGTVGPAPTPPDDLIFADDFESGDLSAWSSTSSDGDLTVDPLAGLASTANGLQAIVNDTTPLWVQDDSPAAEGRYRVRFYLHPNGFDPGEASGTTEAQIFAAYADSGRKLFWIQLRRVGGAYSLAAKVKLDNGSIVSTGFCPISDAPHAVEVEWRRAAGATSGRLALWVDGASIKTKGGLDNSNGRVERVRLGLLTVGAGASGTLRWDQFESRRLNLIGP